jgi:hypothetical protein
MHCESNITTIEEIATPPTAVEITNPNPILLISDSTIFTAQIIPANASYDSLVWISSNEKVLQFLSNGMAIPKSSGATTISVAVKFNNKTVFSKNQQVQVAYRSRSISSFPPEIEANNSWTYISIEIETGFERPGRICKIAIDSVDAISRKTFWYTETFFSISESDTIPISRHDSISMINPPTSGFFSYLGILDTTGNKTLVIEGNNYNVVEYYEYQSTLAGYAYYDYLKGIGLVHMSSETGGLHIGTTNYLLSFESSEHQVQEFFSASSFNKPQD